MTLFTSSRKVRGGLFLLGSALMIVGASHTRAAS
jgi:hypothetical protein